MRWVPLVVVSLAAAACVDMQDDSASIVGTSGDVVTEAGDYVGYRVVTPCDAAHVNVGVIGTGSNELTEIADISSAGRELSLEIRDIASVWGYGGYGVACEPGVGTSIETNSWRDVDLIITRAGEFLRERDVAVQINIRVGGVPVAH